MKRLLIAALLCASVTLAVCFAMSQGPKLKLTSFPPQVNINVKKNDQVDYSIDLSKQRYAIFVPPNFNSKERFGLVVYIPPFDNWDELPGGWDSVLARHKLLLVAPQQAGNSCQHEHRLGAGIVGALAAIQNYNLDRARIYAAGLSGGARTAGGMACYQSDLFSGTIQDCGADFYRPVPHVRSQNWTDSQGNQYGNMPVSDEDAMRARSKVRFVLITGPGDFRRGNILDLYEGGFKPLGFACKLLDVPGQQHADCSGETLEQALTFIETGR